MLPIIFLKSLKNIGFFSFVVMVFTFVSIVLIIITCWDVYNSNLSTLQKEYGLKITAEDREYVEWNFAEIPMFCAAMMNLFEGNQQILNLYAESSKPSQFYGLLTVIFIVLLMFVAIAVGMLGYMAFGKTCESVIVLNLPNTQILSILAKSFYVITIIGSFVLLAQPIFYVVESSEFYKKVVS